MKSMIKWQIELEEKYYNIGIERITNNKKEN